MRHADRRFGSAERLEWLRGQISELDDLIRHTLLQRHRAPLAGVLTEASTLAGWTSLDIGSLKQAWAHYEQAKSAAREAESAALLAHATAEQAFVLIDAGNVEDAVELFAEARDIGKRAPRLLRAWLAAAQGEGHAISGDGDNALRSFDEADELRPSELVHPELPFLFLGGTHLDRWRGNALVHLGAEEAISHLEAVIEGVPSEFVRARASACVDLALAYSAAGDREGAETYARQGLGGCRNRPASSVDSSRHVEGASSSAPGVPSCRELDGWRTGRSRADALAYSAEEITMRSTEIVLRLLGGDFNVEPEDPRLAPLRRELHDALAPARPLPTWPAEAPEQQLDHVWISAGLSAERPASVNSTVSDHLPVEVTVRRSGLDARDDLRSATPLPD
ncbi:endonuclease/exonuclease/phosphatase family protein [Amycolatopsis sp. 195334CR]|uniref:endonuclease/exonuclease/phosphatase family protein n=1 Tax=Amycolatopsis sp. 195334CR TaxID=2814588 RepID=UPI0027DE2CA0|nr:endonuclease/exonuclease/phosphatase family protein [Amycolatopsis sp. 195334CR]